MWRIYMLFQGRTTTTQAYLEQSQNMIDVIQHSGGIIGEDSGVEKMILGKKSKDNLSEAELIDLQEEIKDRSMAVAFRLGADRLQYGKLVKNMENDNLQGRNNFLPLCQPPIIYSSIGNRIPNLVSARWAPLAMKCHSTLLMEVIQCCSMMKEGGDRKEKLMWPAIWLTAQQHCYIRNHAQYCFQWWTCARDWMSHPNSKREGPKCLHNAAVSTHPNTYHKWVDTLLCVLAQQLSWHRGNIWYTELTHHNCGIHHWLSTTLSRWVWHICADTWYPW